MKCTRCKLNEAEPVGDKWDDLCHPCYIATHTKKDKKVKR